MSTRPTPGRVKAALRVADYMADRVADYMADGTPDMYEHEQAVVLLSLGVLRDAIREIALDVAIDQYLATEAAS